MKIGIVGGGSIGLLISGFLGRQHDVTIYVRRDNQKKMLNEQGLRLANNKYCFPIQALLLDEIQGEDLLVICVKQPEVLNVLKKVRMLNEQIPLLFLQNGMGHVPHLKMLENPIIVGVVEHGALRVDDHHVRHTGKGRIKIAAYSGEHELLVYLTKQLNQQHFPVEYTFKWKELLADKLIINAVINPLTALFNVPNGMILENTYIRELAQELCKETVEVLGLNFYEHWNRLEGIARSTRENESSMLTDVRNKQTTEIEAISGYILGLSKVDLPYTSFVYNAILALETRQETRNEYR